MTSPSHVVEPGYAAVHSPEQAQAGSRNTPNTLRKHLPLAWLFLPAISALPVRSLDVSSSADCTSSRHHSAPPAPAGHPTHTPRRACRPPRSQPLTILPRPAPARQPPGSRPLSVPPARHPQSTAIAIDRPSSGSPPRSSQNTPPGRAWPWQVALLLRRRRLRRHVRRLCELLRLAHPRRCRLRLQGPRLVHQPLPLRHLRP